MTSAHENGASSALATYSYDPLSRRTNLAYLGGTSMAYSYSHAGDLLSLNQTLGGTGTVPNFTLGYTAAHQLNSEASSQSSYVWMPSGTHTDSYAAANKLNQYTTINSAPASGADCHGAAQQYSYDCNGNLTGDGIWTYAYDSENRLITANKTSGGTVTATYAYDPLGRRTHKSGTGVTETYFVDDGADEIAEYNASGTPLTRYVSGPGINEPIAQITVSGGGRRFFLTDHHGSTIAIANSSGTQIEGPYTYDAYGNGAPATGTPYKYVGMRLDAETGLYYDRARMYSSALGRFLQVDPVGYTADLNLYAYVGNDPNDKMDSLGTFFADDPQTSQVIEELQLKWMDEHPREAALAFGTTLNLMIITGSIASDCMTCLRMAFSSEAGGIAAYAKGGSPDQVLNGYFRGTIIGWGGGSGSK